MTVKAHDVIAIMREAKVKFFQHDAGYDKLDLKGLNQLVTNIDLATEKFLVERLGLLIEDASFITEENIGKPTNSAYQWIIDPLDGTTNFVHQIPTYSISIALQHHGETIAGFVYELCRDEMFWATKEDGAWLNNTPIHVSNTNKIKDSLIATGFPYYTFERVDDYLSILKHFILNTRGVRRIGSAAVDLVYVACGRFDGFFEMGLSPWDVAAGGFIVQMAGGQCLDFSKGNNYIFGGEIIAGNMHMAAVIHEVVNSHWK